MRTKAIRTLTPLALAVLKLLQERAMHPYEMHQLIRERGLDNIIKVRAGSLYHSVERLQQLSMVEPVETGRAGRRPERTVYAITEVGRDAYQANLRDLVREPVEEYPVFAAAVEMLHTLPRRDAIRLLQHRVTALEAQLAALEQVGASLAKRGIPHAYTIELDYLLALGRAELAWVGQLVDDIRSGDLPWVAETKEHAS